MSEQSRSWRPWRRSSGSSGEPTGASPSEAAAQPLEDTSVVRDEPIWRSPEPISPTPSVEQPSYAAPASYPQPPPAYSQPPAYPHPFAASPVAPLPSTYREPAYRQSEPSSGTRSRLGWVVLAALLAGLLGGSLGAAAVVGLDDGDTDSSVSAPEPVEELPTSGSAEPLPAGNSSVVTVAERTLPSVVQIKVSGGEGESGTGSGFVLDERGHVVTNNHVVEVAAESGRITVVLQDGSERRAEIVGRSPSYDIAVIKVDGKGLVASPLGRSSKLQVGQTVVAVGSPLGLSSTVTSGIVSALDRPVTTGSSDANSYISAVQTDAAINPGNSGGPLVDLRGRVVGVNTAIAQVGSLSGQSGSIGVGFAVPIDQVQRTAAQILADGEARYPVIGASVDTVNTDGAAVSDVTDGGPAQQAGLRPGDIVTEVDGVAVEGGTQLIVAIRSYQPGDTITLTYERDGDRRRVDVVLDSMVDEVG